MTKPRILILGGGFGGLFTALELAGSADVTLVSDADHFLFTPMLYEYLSGEVEAWHIAPRYDELLDENVRCVQDTPPELTSHRKPFRLQTHEEKLNYDVLVLAVGGITNYVGVEGAEEFSLPFRKTRSRRRTAQANGRCARSNSARDAAPGRTPRTDICGRWRRRQRL